MVSLKPFDVVGAAHQLVVPQLMVNFAKVLDTLKLKDVITLEIEQI